MQEMEDTYESEESEEEIEYNEDGEEVAGRINGAVNGMGAGVGRGEAEEQDKRSVDELVQRGQARLRDPKIHRLSPYIQIAENPTHRKILGHKIVADYGAMDLISAIQQYVEPFSPMFADIIHDGMAFSVWSRVTLHHDRLPFAPLAGRKIDHLRASPATYNRYNRLQREPQFDTALFVCPSGRLALHHYYAARVLVTFRLPPLLKDVPAEPLVYIKPFTRFSTSASNPHQLFTTSPVLDNNCRRVAQVVPLSSVRMTCQLVPKYTESTLASRTYKITSSTDLLSSSKLFYLNRHSSYYFFSIMEHWRRMEAERRHQQH